MPGFVGVLTGPRHVYEYVNDAYVAISGPRDFIGRSVRDVFPELAGQGFCERLDQVYATGERYAARALPMQLADMDDLRFIDLNYEPIRDEDGAVTGIFIGGYDVTTTIRTASALAESQDRYRSLLGTLTTAFCIIEMKYDDAGKAIDYRFIETNAAFAVMTDLHDAVGRWVNDIAPGLEQFWFDLYGNVATTGLPARAENWAEVLGRWYDVQVHRVGAPGDRRVAILFEDITAKKQVQARQAALLELNDVLRDLTDPDEIAQSSSKILARALNVGRVGYGLVDTVAETITIDRDYNAPGIHTLAGVVQFRDFGSYIEDLKRGEPVIIADATKDPRTRDNASSLAAISATALVNIPLIEKGQVVALVFANNATPRVWAETEIALIREIAERVRSAVERARAAAELNESETRFRNMADNTPMIMWVTDPSGWCSYLNKTWYEFTGQSEGEAEGYGWLDATHPDDKAHAEEAFVTANAARAPFRVEYRLRRADGTYRWAIDAASPRFDAAGEYLGYVGSVIDIDDRREMENALRSSEAQLEVLLAGSKAEVERLWDLSPDLLTVVNYEGTLERINPSWTRVLGHDEQTLLTRPYVEILHPDEIADIGDLLAKMRETEQPVMLEDRLLTADGNWRSFVWTLSPEPGGERLYGVGRDVTEERARERELAIAQEALRQSQKMEAVGQLTGGIAHDFNNLLAGISGSLELLEKRMSQGRLAGVERYINGAQESARRAATLTQRLLAFSRRQTLDPKPTDVNRLIAGMEDLIRRTVGPNIEVEVVGAGGLWTTRIDPSQLENALLNLAINGRDSMAPHGGRLTIETANKWLDERSARERDLLPGQYVSLCVTDTGTGMTPGVMSKAFEPFFTTKPLGQGTGLGLSMIHGFVRQSGGQVRIYSEVGQGTTMCLYLPRYADELDETDILDIPHETDRGHGEVVLVIDDEATVRMLIVEVLQDAGYIVLEAEDGPSGLRILQSDTRIDLLITDVGLPGGMNGRQVADAARISRPDLKILFVTGYAENAAVGNGHLDPGMAVITKPFAVTALGNKAREMIEG